LEYRAAVTGAFATWRNRLNNKERIDPMEISAINSALSTVALHTQYQVVAAKKSMDTQCLLGEAALKLIQSASIDPNIGQKLNIFV